MCRSPLLLFSYRHRVSKIVASFHFRRGMGRPHSTLPQEIFIQRYVIVFLPAAKPTGHRTVRVVVVVVVVVVGGGLV